MEELCGEMSDATEDQDQALTSCQAKKNLTMHQDILDASRDRAQISASADMLPSLAPFLAKSFAGTRES